MSEVRPDEPNEGGGVEKATAPDLPQPDGPPVPPEIVQMFQALPAFQGASPQVIARAVSASFSSSPFPDGDDLAKYNGVIEGGANRVMVLVENQAAHRQDLERRSVEADIELRKLGLILGFALSLVAVVGGIALVAAGDQIGALAALLPGIAGLAGVFIWWQKSRQETTA